MASSSDSREDHTCEVPAFDRRFFEGKESFTRIGGGSLGGKAHGLAQVRATVLGKLDASAFPGVTVDVPRLTVIATDVFDSFVRTNRLEALLREEAPDDRLAHAFLKADLPVELVGDLTALVNKVHTPLAVRSSSMLEDALEHPFAGVYATKMIPNHQLDPSARFKKLVEAVKLVWASTFFSVARSHREAVLGAEAAAQEKMAVIIQEIVGLRHGNRFYPCVSGVARSYNYYPTGHGEPGDGVVNLALGLGKTIVDGGLPWTYSPPWPASPPPFNDIGDLMKNSQTAFWAVDMGPFHAYDPTRETEYMKSWPLDAAEEDGTLRFSASTLDAGSGRLRPGIGTAGPRVLDFAPLLRQSDVPFNEAVRALLEACKARQGAEVELEFAATLDPRDGVPARLGFLQMRPMAAPGDDVPVSADDLTRPGTLVASTSVLGNGAVEGLKEIVYLKPAAFDAAATEKMAVEIEALNRRLLAERRPYILIGFGRWGSSDSWLGVPVNWGQICGAKVIVEATLPKMSPELSQGSHFFHNLIGQRVLYLSVSHAQAPGIDWAWLDAQPAQGEGPFTRHITTASPLTVRVDGKSGRGVIQRDEQQRR